MTSSCGGRDWAWWGPRSYLGAQGHADDGGQLVDTSLHPLESLAVAVEVQLLWGRSERWALVGSWPLCASPNCSPSVHPTTSRQFSRQGEFHKFHKNCTKVLPWGQRERRRPAGRSAQWPSSGQRPGPSCYPFKQESEEKSMLYGANTVKYFIDREMDGCQDRKLQRDRLATVGD